MSSFSLVLGSAGAQPWAGARQEQADTAILPSVRQRAGTTDRAAAVHGRKCLLRSGEEGLRVSPKDAWKERVSFRQGPTASGYSHRDIVTPVLSPATSPWGTRRHPLRSPHNVLSHALSSPHAQSFLPLSSHSLPDCISHSPNIYPAPALWC